MHNKFNKNQSLNEYSESSSFILKRRVSVISLVIGTMFLNGCSSYGALGKDEQALVDGPNYVRWMPREFTDVPLPYVAGKSPDPSKANGPNEINQLPRPSQAWWTDFGNEELNELIDSGLSNNYDLRVAIARLEQAEKQALIAEAARYPSINFFAGAESKGPAAGVGTARTRDEFTNRQIFQFGFRATYEVDVWGKAGYQAQSALALARASFFNRQAVALTLTSEIASGYFQLLSLMERIATAEKNLEVAKSVGEAISKRVERGDASVLEQQQQQITIALVENGLAALKLQKERAFTRLALLLGKAPSSLKIKAKTLDQVKLPDIEPGLPSELLCRRPDVRRAEQQLVAAREDVNAARANILPSFSMTAEYGQGSYKLADILSPQSLLYSIAGNMVANVFDYDKKDNLLGQARARNKELLETYANTVLSSLRDVEDALSGIRLTRQQYQALHGALGRSNRLLEFSQLIYKKGALDFVGLQQIQRDVFTAEDSEASARYEQLKATIDLYKSLGGGVSPDDPCTQIGKEVQEKMAADKLANDLKADAQKNPTMTAPSDKPIIETEAKKDSVVSPVKDQPEIKIDEAPAPKPDASKAQGVEATTQPLPKAAEVEKGVSESNQIISTPSTTSTDIVESPAIKSDVTKSSAPELEVVTEQPAPVKKLTKKEKAEADKAAKLQAQQEAKAKAEAERLEKAKAKAEADRLAKEKAEADKAAKLQAQQEAKAKAEAERLEKAQAKAEADRLVKEKTEADKAAKLQAQQEAKAKAEAERLEKAQAKAEADRLAKEKAEADKAAKLQAQQEAKAKAEADRLVKEKAEADKAAKLQAQQEAKAKAEAERLEKAKAKAEADRLVKEKAEADKAAKLQAQQEAKAKAEAERLEKAQAKAEAEAERKAVIEEKLIYEESLKARRETLLRQELERNNTVPTKANNLGVANNEVELPKAPSIELEIKFKDPEQINSKDVERVSTKGVEDSSIETQVTTDKK